MKNLALLFLLFFSASATLFAQNQTAYIEGTEVVCDGECGTFTYYIADANGEVFTPQEVTWQLSNGNIYNGNPIEICFDLPGTYSLIAFDNEFNTEASFTYIVDPGFATVIESTAPACPDAPYSDCETVCAGTTVTYFTESGGDIEWTVEGSDNFEIDNGNGFGSVVVTWEEAGEGSVTVFTNAQDTLTGFFINCGEAFGVPDISFGEGYVYIEGNPDTEYIIEVFDGPILVSETTGSVGLNIIGQLFAPGEYFVNVTDIQTGESVSCSFILGEDPVCSLSAYPEFLTLTTGCNACNGGGFWIAEGGTAPYTYQWNNGSTGSGLEGLCAGDYEVTITDAVGCEITRSFTIADQCQTTTNCPTSATICVNILEEPDAQFTTAPAPSGNTVEICEGQSLFFENQSTGAGTFIWDFGDFNTSVQTNPEHLYENPGTYTVSLIARNDCFCADTMLMTVNVIDADVPEIGCVGTICEDTEVTYTSDADCGSFDWTISGNGIITDGGGANDDFVTVNWGSGPEGEISLAVSGCTGNVCTLPNVAFIPIISDDATIEGPTQVCNETEAIYTLPKYDGTDYVWSVSNFGTIIDGQSTHQITVKWEGNVPNNAQSVSVVYENCYLECGGSADLPVAILPEFYVQSSPVACENETVTFTGVNAENGGAASLDYELFAPDGTSIFTENGMTFSSPAVNAGPGAYRMVVTPANVTDWCTDSYEFIVLVNPMPVAPTGINGELTVCPGEPYAYTAVSTLAGASFVWEINDNGTISTAFGSTINVIWSAGSTYSLAVAQVDNAGLNCLSDQISVNLNPLGTVTVTGDEDVCLEETAIYTATDYAGVDYAWEIIPASAGTIASGAGSNEIEVFWTNDGNAQINLTVCGTTETTAVLVRPKPTPVVNAPEWLCFNETAAVSTTVVYNAYAWKNENGAVVSTDATPDLGPGFYDVLVTNEFGCTENVAFEIRRYPPPSVSISTPDNNFACLAEGGSFPVLYAENTETGYTFQWTLDGTAVGTNSPILPTAAAGNYQVAVTDVNGCSVVSNIITVSEGCDPTGGGQCSNPNDGEPIVLCDDLDPVTFSATPNPECNTLLFQTTAPGVQSVVVWDFNDGSFSTQTNPSHTFADAGFYRVVVNAFIDNGSGGTNLCSGLDIITVPVAAKFDAQSACRGEEMFFTDLTTFIPGEGIATHTWDFGDPTSTDNFSTLAEPTHIYADAGTYTVSLTVTSTAGCISTKTSQVTVYAQPTVSFDEPVVNCAATSLEFIAQVAANVTEVEWDFGDPTSAEANTATAFNPYHTYAFPGDYDVTLTAVSIYGCSETYTTTITVEPNNLAGSIAVAPSASVCEGDAATLTAPPGGTAWFWSTGENTETITVLEGGVYDVTVTDDEGCAYSPAGQPVEVIPLPQGDIYAVEYDEFDNPVAYNFSTHEVCEGEDVFLEIENVTNYSYSWNLGGSMTATQEFSEDKGNQLEAGTYDIEVTITDTNTGCTNVSAYQVIVHGVPQNVTIISDSGTPICAGSGATFSVQNPNASFDYVWNTGEIGTSIVIIAGGEYWVTAVNEFGCEGESNHIEVENAPDIDKIPDGCHTRCAPDTICLPTLQNIASYQWYLDGTAIPAPEGTVADLIAEESGEYYLVMVDIFGCEATSDILTLDLIPGEGDIDGNVYLDTNENGIIDAGDELLPDIDVVLLTDTGTNAGSDLTDADGLFTFDNVPAGNYFAAIDEDNLVDTLSVVIGQEQVIISGCDGEYEVNLLLQVECPTATDTALSLTSCDGNAVDYAGNMIAPGATETFTFINQDDCDSTVTVTVIDGFVPPLNETYTVCAGETVTVEGQILAAGTLTDIPYTNEFGCESVLTVEVLDGSTPILTEENFTVCAGETYEYEGFAIAAGETETVTLSNAAGCDSTVQVTVTALTAAAFEVSTVGSCWNIADGSISIVEPASGNPPYLYSLDGSTFGENFVFTNLIGGAYTVYVSDANDCVFEQAVEVPATERLSIEIPEVIMECGAQDVTLNAVVLGGRGDITQAWQDGTTDNTLTVPEAGIYTFTATDECGTTTTQTEVLNESDTRASVIYVPNAFSPNADGKNDEARGFAANDIEVLTYNLMIFDRWGNMMAEVKNVNEGWNGIYEGRMMTSAVFTYVVSAKVMSCGVEQDVRMTGDITLVR